MEAELSFPQKGAEEPGQPEFCTPPWPTPLLAVPHLTLIPLARSPTVLQAATASGTTTAGNSPVDHVTGRLPSPCCCPAGDLPFVSRLGPTGEVCALACTCVCTEEALAWHWPGTGLAEGRPRLALPMGLLGQLSSPPQRPTHHLADGLGIL